LKHQLLLIMLMLSALFAQVACSASATADPNEIALVQTETVPQEAKISVEKCAQPVPGTLQLIYAAVGVCFLYPEKFGVFQAEDGSLTLYVRSLLNTEAPLATIRFTPLDGRPIQEVVPDYPSDAELATMSFPVIELGEEMATVFDNLPGQDTNRRVIAVHNDKVYDLMIARIGEDYGAVGEEAEDLYDLITGSFQFIGTEPNAPLLAGPECPQAVDGKDAYTNAEDGFCMLLPAGYTVDDSLTTGDGGTETAVYIGSLQDVTHAHLFITVLDAGGRSLEEITAEKAAGLEESVPGFEANYSFGTMLDGVPANQFDGVPGQDLSRQVVLVHDGRLFTFSFIPDDPDSAEAYAEMQTLYGTVLDSFNFFWSSE